MDEQTLSNMRSRVERCRRLARECTDERTAAILRQMADEGEADINRVLAERGASGSANQQAKSSRA